MGIRWQQIEQMNRAALEREESQRAAFAILASSFVLGGTSHGLA